MEQLLHLILLLSLTANLLSPLTLLNRTTPSPGQAPPWLKYVDPTYGIHFDYPATGETEIVDHDQQDDIVSKRRITIWAPERRGLVNIDIWEDIDNPSLIDWYNQHQRSYYDNVPLTEPNIKLSGRPGIFVETKDKYGSLSHLTAFILRDNTVVRLEYPFFYDVGASLEVFRQILTTFRFSVDPKDAAIQLPPLEDFVNSANLQTPRVLNCCGNGPSPGNPYSCCPIIDEKTNKVIVPQTGNCTWYVWYRFVTKAGNKAPSCTGNALNWKNCAAPNNSKARVGAIVVFQPGVHGAHSEPIKGCPKGCGHVAYVTKVHPDGKFDIVEDSCWGTCGVYNRSKLTVKPGVNFIYGNADTTPPTNPTTLSSSTHTAGQWSPHQQVTLNWSGATDPKPNPTGVGAYYLTWTQSPGTKVDKKAEKVAANVQSVTKTLPDGVWWFHLRTVDNAGNWAGTTIHYGPFRIDTTPPSTLTNLQETHGLTSGIWQNSVGDPAFVWGAGQDAGSGIAAYRIYWGPLPNGVPDTDIDNQTSYDPPPVIGSLVTNYLRVVAVDQANNTGSAASFTFKYDFSSPTGSLLINSDATSTGNTLVYLTINAQDQGIGLGQMRLSNDGSNWADWQAYSSQIPWILPAQNLVTHTVYLQLQDQLGNQSSALTDTIFLNFGLPQGPSSENYAFGSRVQASSGKGHSSSSYYSHTTGGQPIAGEVATSSQYRLYGGYQGGILPLQVTSITGLALTPTISPQAFISPPPELVLPPSASQISSMNAQATKSVTYSIAINDHAQYSASLDVLLTLSAPDAVEMMLSDDSTFQDAYWEAFSITRTWEISVPDTYSPPSRVYVRFKDSQGDIHGNFVDGIIFDSEPPAGTATILNKEPDQVTIQLDLTDNLSQVARIAVSTVGGFETYPWRPAVSQVTLPYEPGDTTVFIFLQDGAGNIAPYPIEVSLLEEAQEKVYLPLLIKN